MTGNWPFSIEFRATGDKGTLNYALTDGFNINDGERGSNLTFYPAGKDTFESIQVEQTDMFEGELREFFNAVRENRPASVTLEQNRGVLQIIEASIRSLEENGGVRL